MQLDTRFGRPRHALAAGVAAMAVSALALASPAQAQPHYAGKELEIVVPFAEGGATDVAARFLQPFMERHIEGNPTVSVVNRPGGGSILGGNWFEDNADEEGTIILFTTSSTSHPYLLGQQEVAYDLASKRVGYSLPFGLAFYVAPETGIEDIGDLLAPDIPLIYGGIAAAASDLPMLVGFEVLEMPVTTVLGFTGRGPVRLAFERGETNVDFQFTPVYMTQVVPLVEEGRAVPIMTGGTGDADGRFTAPDPALPDLPTIFDAHVELYGEEPSGVVWDAYQMTAGLTFQYGLTAFLHENVPQEVLDVLNAAVEAINADPEFQERAQEVTGGYILTRGDVAEPAIHSFLDPDPEVREYLRTLLADKYDVQF
jgi:hypothetical protein